MIARAAALAAGALAALATTFAHAQVTLANAWMRPAAAGQPAAVYVDIQSTAPSKLVGAESPVAGRAEIVLVEDPASPTVQKVVSEMSVAPGRLLRLAYLGSHIRLVDLRTDVLPGTRVPLALVFVDARGASSKVAVEAEVRGLSIRSPEATKAQ